MTLQEENYQLLINLVAQVIRSGQLESGLSSNSKKLTDRTLKEIFDLFKSRTIVLERTIKVKDLTTFSQLGIDREKITNVYIKDVGDVISSTMVFDVDGNIVLPSSFDDYLENDCLIKFIDYNWIGDENGN